MDTRVAVKPYQLLARHYDEVFATFRSPIDAARQKLLAPVLNRIHTACDLACGTGDTALALAKRGIRTYAVDLSPLMCQLTRNKAKKAGVSLRVMQSDMRNFTLPERVELITCEGDALNHVPRRVDLIKVARCAARALRPGGYFFFDLNNLEGFKRYWSGTLLLEKPGVFVAMRNGNDVSALRAWSDIDWFVREKGGWRRSRERVEEVCWSEEEIRKVFCRAGFGALRRFDAKPFYKDNSMVKRGCRSIYLAQK